MTKIPRAAGNDYTPDAADARRRFLEAATAGRLHHLGQYSFDPATVAGNIEHFTGVAQVPIGIAGPLLVDGEYARGEFYVPLATTEGTLVASYNRGMKLVREAGGVKTTISDDAMQRAPVFLFDSAREARAFGRWVSDNIDTIRARAEATTGIGRLRDVEQYPVARCVFLQFNYTTGDAAGQNIVSKATKAVCDWMRESYPDLRHYYLGAALDSDKRPSHINLLRTRGKRVTAEATISRALIWEQLHTTPELMFRARQVSNLGTMLSGAVSNGSQPANGLTALFIATGQDVANVTESSSALAHFEITPDGDYYYSLTLPSLIVATFGGGTGCATQRECLEILGCYGGGKVQKFAEIVAATILCGELSLAGAVASEEWVASHERYGRKQGSGAHER